MSLDLTRAKEYGRLMDELDGCPLAEQLVGVARIADPEVRTMVARALASRYSPDDLPERIGDYKILKKLGSGGYGTVFLGEDREEHGHRPVAVKVYRPRTGIVTAAERARDEREFLAEAARLGRCQHEGIVPLLASGVQTFPTGERRPYLVTAWIDGELITIAARGQEIERRIRLMVAVCEAVQAAHRCELAHLDLKPQNILVRKTAPVQPVVLDFGIAQSITAPGTGEHGACTISYASPEQLDAGVGTPDFRSDVYALGVVLFEMLTDRYPYRFRAGSTPTPLDFKEAIVAPDSRVALKEFGAPYDARISDIVARAMAYDPKRRYDSPTSFARALEEWREARKSAEEAKSNRRAAVSPGSTVITQRDYGHVAMGNMIVRHTIERKRRK